MATQSPPYALQNAAHSAALFRQAAFSAWRGGGTILAADLQTTAQSTPNMSVQVSAGRVWLPGSQVSAVSGGTWTTQAGYFGINDAPVTVTIATADATNPRIDTVYVAVNDSAYSGSTDNLVIGVVTGTPAASPSAPAAPSNSVVLATVAVAANATSIVSGNISVTSALLTIVRGGIRPVTASDTSAAERTGEYRDHPTAALQRWDGTGWRNMFGGFLGQAGAGDGSLTANTTVVSATVSVPANLPSGSRLKVTGSCFVSTGAGNGATVTVAGSGSTNRSINQGSIGTDLTVVYIDSSLTSGNRTFTVSVAPTVSGQTVTYRQPVITVEVI